MFFLLKTLYKQMVKENALKRSHYSEFCNLKLSYLSERRWTLAPCNSTIV